MTVLEQVMCRTSTYSLRDLQKQARHLPLYLLERVCHESPTVAATGNRVARIASALSTRNEPCALWRDCDLYYPIFTLFEAIGDEPRTEALLRRLELQLGLRPMEEFVALPGVPYRLVSLTGSVWQSDGERLTRLTGAIATPPPGAFTVYLPLEGLFRDVLPPERYPVPAGADLDVDRLLAKVSDACRLLSSIAPELWHDVQDAISTIVLVPAGTAGARPFDPLHATWSYNLRLRYFGGIFITATHVDAYAVLEAIAHEYLHQRMWQWWELAQPDGLPAPHVTMTSPITGVERPTYVMVQALVIYVTAYLLHRAVASRTDLSSDSTHWMQARIAQLHDGIPRLSKALRRAVRAGTETAALIDTIDDCFERSQGTTVAADPQRAR